MLILSRRVGEVIMIGDDIAVTVLGTMGNNVKIGVTAPAEIAVHREEIYEQVQKEKRGEIPAHQPKPRAQLEPVPGVTPHTLRLQRHRSVGP